MEAGGAFDIGVRSGQPHFGSCPRCNSKDHRVGLADGQSVLVSYCSSQFIGGVKVQSTLAENQRIDAAAVQRVNGVQDGLRPLPLAIPHLPVHQDHAGALGSRSVAHTLVCASCRLDLHSRVLHAAHCLRKRRDRHHLWNSEFRSLDADNLHCTRTLTQEIGYREFHAQVEGGTRLRLVGGGTEQRLLVRDSEQSAGGVSERSGEILAQCQWGCIRVGS
mmetsp:Transcript_57547/g.132704  ORF Transcript_57547/g.132704 Transcript_57547/m.132704 type:complete len:219 (-) Transcript_57547:1695-2351(-)